jgi:Domain of unknown function (DUF4345)
MIACKLQVINDLFKMSKNALKYTTVVLGLIPVVTGTISMMGVVDPLYVAAGIPRDPLLDSNLRFFGGLWLGLGLALVWIAPRVQTETNIFRLLWGMIFIGGIGRLLSMVFIGLPPWPFIGFTVLEIVGAPLFVLWQMNISKAST